MKAKSVFWILLILISSLSSYCQIPFLSTEIVAETGTYNDIFNDDSKLIDPAGPFCETDASVILTATPAGGVWAGPGITDPVNGTFDPAVAGPGDHTITYTTTGTQTISIHVDAIVDATITPIGTLCEGSAPVNLSAVDGGGVWAGPGIIDPTNGIFDPGFAGAGTHTVSYNIVNGQCTDSDTEDIDVDAYPDSDWTLIGPFCITDAAENIISVNGGGTFFGSGITDAINGTFDPMTAGIGTHSVGYSIINGVCNSITTKDIEVMGLVDATITPAGPFCDNDNITYLSAADAGGTWSGTGIVNASTGAFDPEIAGAGVFVITYDINNGGCSDTDTESITVFASPDATFPPIPDVCEDDPPFDIIPNSLGGTWSGSGITDVLNGTFDPSVAGAGSHMVMYTISNANCTSSEIRRINVDTLVIATITPVGPFCDNDPAVTLSAFHPGGTWSGTGITDPVNGEFNPTVAGAGTHTITYDITSGACEDTDNTSIDVLAAPDATITDPGEFCSDDPAINLSAATPGGTWAGSGITDPINGTFDPSAASPGANVVTYTVTSGGCTSVGSISITVYDAAVDATITPAGPICISNGQIVLSAASPGGTWSGTGITDAVNGVFDPSVAGIGNHVVTYDVGIPACFDTDTETIQVDDSLSAIITGVPPVCESDAAFNFIAANPGGIWSGTGITDAVNGVFDPTIAGAGTHVITYTITQGVCTNVDTYNMQVDASVDATITPAGPICIDGGQIALSAVSNGGTWSGTGIIDAVNGIFDPSVSGVGTFVIAYNITNGSCLDSDTENIQVDDTLSAIINGVPPVCENDPSFNFTAATPGGTWSGTGITNPLLGTFDPSVSGGGTYTITYTISQGVCTNVDTYLMQVDDAVDATITPAGPLCIDVGATNLSAVSTGGTWSGTGITDAVNGIFDPSVSGVGTFAVTYDVINGTCSDTDTENIQVDDTLSAIINGVPPVCESDAPFNFTAANPGGTWSGNGITDAINGTFDPSVSGDGTHTITYTISQGVCTNIDTYLMQVDASVNATITPAGPICVDAGPIALSAISVGGTWSGTGITDAVNGTFDPSVATPGSHIITYDVVNGTCSDSDTETIQVDDSLSAIITSVPPVCTNDPVFDFVAANPGGTWSGTGVTDALNGTFDPLLAGAGTHTITYTISQGVCTNVDTYDVDVFAGVDATITPAGPFCETDAAVNLTAAEPGGTWSGTGITDAINGTFDPLIANPGVHTITYSLTIGTCSNTDTENITVYLYPDSDWFDIGPFCAGDAAEDIIPVTGGGVFSGNGITDPILGTFDPAVAGVGTHQITYTLTNGTCTSITTKPVDVYVDVDATITPAGPYCDNDNIVVLSASESGGTWSGTGITNPSAGAFSPAAAGSGLHEIVYEISNANCTDSDTIDILVYLSPDATFPEVTDICEDDPAFDIIPNSPGGTWSGTGIIDPINGTFDPATAGPGSHMITYTLSNANCTSMGIRRIDVDPAVDATITPAGPFCENDAEQILTAVDAGGTWSGIGITNATTGAFNPAIAGPGLHVITYGLAVGACEDTTTSNIQVDILPNSTINPDGPFCSSDPAVNLTSVTPGGTWSGTGIIDPINGTFDPVTSGGGDFTITYTLVNGACTSQSTTSIHVDDAVDATITPVAPVCEYDAAFDLTAVDSGGTWSGTGITNPVNGTFDPTIAGPGLHTITYTISNGVCTDTDTEVIDVSADPNSTVFAAGPFCADDPSVILTSVTAGGTWSGNGITDPITGEFDPGVAGGGDHLITYTLTVGACTNSSSITIHVDASVDATITSTGPFCLYDAATNLNAVSAGGTWGGVGITDVNLGTFNPTVAGVGTWTISYSVANGLCSDSDTQDIDVLPASDATINDPGEFCSDDLPVNLTAVTPGGTWSGTGITDAINGTFDPSVANDGGNLVTYTVSLAGCVSVGTITIFVYDAAVDATITTTGPYCISDGQVTLSAVSSGGTWSGTGIIDPINGTFDLNVAGVGSHLITYDVGNPACFDTDSQTIQIDDSLSAIITPVAAVCENASAFDFTAANNGGIWSGTGITNAALGTFNPVVAGNGTHTITYIISQGVCTNIDTYDMQVDEMLDATITPAGPFCENDPITTLTSADPGGTWSGTGIVNTVTGMFHPAVAGPGDHTITYTIVNGTCTDTDTENIHVDSYPNTTISAAGPFCETDAALNLNAATGGGFWSGTGITDIVFGTFDPSVAGGGSHIITYEIINGACTSTSTETIDVDDFYDATITPAGPFCNTEASTNLTAASAGGVWSGTGITDVALGTFHPGVSGPGDFIIQYQTINGTCSDTDTETIHVDEYFDATINPASDFCEIDPAVNLTSVNPGGVWSGTGIIIPANGTFDPATAGDGDHIIAYEIANGACYSSDTETVHVDDQPDATITPVGPYCENESAINLTAVDNGGTWGGTGITNAITGAFNPAIAGPGDHVITYDIVNGECSDSDTETIHVDSYPDTNLASFGPYCETDASVDLTEPSIGGTWSGNGIMDILTGEFDPAFAGSGTHTITYTVVNGACTSSGTTNIDVDATVDATITDVGPFCDTDVSLNLSAASTGGDWSGSGIVNTVTGLFNPAVAGGGSHTITYYVENGTCNDTDNTTIEVDAAPTVTILTTGPFCESDGNQIFTADVSGGDWSGNGIDITGNFSPSTAGVGTHQITYTLISGACTVIEQVDIVVNQYYDAEILSTGPYCYNDTPFNLSSVNSGGEWSGPGTTIDGLFSPAAAGVGNHIITYEITNGACYDSDTQSISVNNNPDATITGPSDICLTEPEFNYSAATSGGLWSGAGITDVVAGTFDPQVSGVGGFLIVYEITVNGCSSIDFDTLTVHDIPVVTLSGLNPHYCIEDESHTVEVSPPGGVLSGGSISGIVFDPQLAGVGTHQITYSYSDINGCADTAFFDLEVHAMPVTSISGMDDYYCMYVDTVYPVLLPLGGTLVGPGAFNNTFVPADAGPGDFELMYHFTDVFGCSDTSYFNTSVIDYADIAFDFTEPTCFGYSNGSITTEVTNATEPFSYLWNDSGLSVTADITSVSSGWYTLEVTDSLNCITVDSVYVTEPTELIVDIINYTDVNCFGLSDAWAIASASGGTPDYTYLWNDTESTDSTVVENLPVGTYIVTVTDSNMCESTDTVVIAEPDTLSVTFTDLQDVSCYNYSNGSVTASPFGGTSPYTAYWNDEASTVDTTLTGVSAGYYTVTIVDDHGCEISDSVLISQPDSIYFESTVNPVICTSQLGSAGITVYGGTAPYDYDWSNGDTVPVLFNVISDTFYVTITDANDCRLESFLEVPYEGEISVDITQTAYNLCYGDKIAELIAFSPDGAPVLSYEWSNFVADSVNPELSADDYYVTISDAWGCSGVDSITVTQPDLLEIELVSENIRCRGELTGSASVSIQGGTQPYSALWSNEDTTFFTGNLGPGEISVTVTDFNSCSISASSIITQPATGIQIDLNVKQVTCYGADDGAINSFASGGSPPYWYTWYINGEEINDATIRNLGVGIYILTVDDNNGCSADTIVEIYQVNSLIATAEAGNTSCIGNVDGYIQVFAGGGTEPYSYYLMDMPWDSYIMDSLARGDYYITVRDSNNCEYSFGPVTVNDTDVDCLRIPAAFSPNGDGYNDEFYIDNLHLYPRAVVQIFNRWGQLLYEDLGINGFWDGTYNGNPVPTGAYLYNIILNINEDPRVGTVTVIR